MTPLAARRIAARTSLACAALALAAVAMLTLLEDYALERNLWAMRGTGYAALGALFTALSMTPLERLRSRVAAASIPATLLPALRRSFGLTAATLATLHAGIGLLTWLRETPAAVLEQPVFRAGGLALFVLWLLALTSFPPVVRALRISLWKHLHRLAYAAAFFAFLHLLLSSFAPRARTLWLFGALATLGLLRLLPSRRASD